MKETDLPSFDVPEEAEATPLSGPTLSIDLSTLFTPDVYSSGTFDLSAISSSSIGRLLDALPIPVLLIDQWFQVGFVNRACGKISSDYQKIKGVPFANLVPLPSDVGKAQSLAQKIQALIERAFATRRPQISEAILEIENNRIWARLHLRSVRIGLERHVLLIIENLTHEKTQLILTRRNDEKYRRANFELGKRIDYLTEEVHRLTKQLEMQTNQHMKALEILNAEQLRGEEFWERIPLSLAVVGNDGSIRRINGKFSETFGYYQNDLNGTCNWISGYDGASDQPAVQNISDWTEFLSSPEDNGVKSVQITRKDGRSHIVTLTAVPIENHELLLIFGE
jgi:PAS domain S-box-containing protein